MEQRSTFLRSLKVCYNHLTYRNFQLFNIYYSLFLHTSPNNLKAPQNWEISSSVDMVWEP